MPKWIRILVPALRTARPQLVGICYFSALDLHQSSALAALCNYMPRGLLSSPRVRCLIGQCPWTYTVCGIQNRISALTPRKINLRRKLRGIFSVSRKGGLNLQKPRIKSIPWRTVVRIPFRSRGKGGHFLRGVCTSRDRAVGHITPTLFRNRSAIGETRSVFGLQV